MKILDQRAGIVGDAETLSPIRNKHGRDKNWQTTLKLRSTPEVIRKRL